MSDEPTIADRLAATDCRLRSPLAHSLAGHLTPLGQDGVAELHGILADLPTIAATGPRDALALASIARDMLDVVAANCTERNDLALEAAGALGQALSRLTLCLAELSGCSPEEFCMAEAKPVTVVH